jgi:hypothetical protein
MWRGNRDTAHNSGVLAGAYVRRPAGDAIV